MATQTFECVRTKFTLVALKAVQRGLLVRVHLAVVPLEAVLDGRRVVTEGTGQLESFVLQSDVISQANSLGNPHMDRHIITKVPTAERTIDVSINLAKTRKRWNEARQHLEM